MRHRTGKVVFRDGSWWARIQYTDANGKRREVRRKPYPVNTRRLAGDLLQSLLRKLGNRNSPRDPTFAEVAVDYVAAHCHDPVYENGIKISGMREWKSVKRMIETVLIPSEIGQQKVSDLTYSDLHALRSARLAAPKKRGGRKVVVIRGRRSIFSVNREMDVVRRVLSFAIDSGYIERSPMKKRGGSLVVVAAEKPRERILSIEEERRLLEHYPARSVDFFIVAIDTGMRRGEQLRLTVGDCDFELGIIRLPWEITKTKRPRVIPMSSRVHTILECRSAKHQTIPIFADLSETIVRNDFRAACSGPPGDTPVDDFQLRDCRATLATRLIQAGMSEGEVAQITGHRFDPRTEIAKTLRKHYLRVDEVTIQRAARILDGYAPRGGG